jgi:hypothetical protein
MAALLVCLAARDTYSKVVVIVAAAAMSGEAQSCYTLINNTLDGENPTEMDLRKDFGSRK